MISGMKKPAILFSIFLFIFFFSSFSQVSAQQISPKKGVAGGAILQTLTDTKTSWFYNWGYVPGYKTTSGFDNWDAKIWQKFIPFFSGKAYLDVDAQMTEICAKTDYCNRGNYYLVGNEPDIADEDLVAGSINPALDAAVFQGEVAKRIKSKDSSAKVIILGLSSKKEDFIRQFISEWEKHWRGTNIADLSTIVQGWHFHAYGDYRECPASDALPRDFLRIVNDQMQKTFGRLIPNQELWITEMGSLDYIPAPYDALRTADRNSFKNRMRCLTNVYENSPVVTRYAWFYFGCNPSIHDYQDCNSKRFSPYNLFFPPNDAYCRDPFCITDLGQVYSTLPSSISPTSTPAPKATLTFTIKFPEVSRNNTPNKNVSLYLGNSPTGYTTVISNLNDGTGKYRGTIDNIPSGIYNIFIKAESRLRKLVQNNVNLLRGTNQYDWSAITLTAGDVNNDNVIMRNDITGIISEWKQSNTPVTSANRQYDLNLDGVISLCDITTIISNWTTSEVNGE